MNGSTYAVLNKSRSPQLSVPSLLKRHDSIPEAPIRISPPHGAEGLQEGDAIASLAKGKRPEGWVLD